MLLFYLENYWCFVERLHIVRVILALKSRKSEMLLLFCSSFEDNSTNQILQTFYETASFIFPSHVSLLI